MFSLLDSLFNKNNIKIAIEEIKTSKIKNEPFTKEDSWNELMDMEASVRKTQQWMDIIIWAYLIGIIAYTIFVGFQKIKSHIGIKLWSFLR